MLGLLFCMLLRVSTLKEFLIRFDLYESVRSKTCYIFVNHNFISADVILSQCYFQTCICSCMIFISNLLF